MSREAFDIAVVGGGAAGCVVANRLAESHDRSVVLLEAGPDLRPGIPAEWRDGWRMPTLPDWEFESEPDRAGATSKLRRGRLLGGTSWLTRFAVRGAVADFDAWAARGNPGWSFAEILPAFRRLEADAEFGGSPWHGDHGPIPVTRYPELEPSAIHAAALDAFHAVGLPTVDDHNAPGAIGVGRMPMRSRGGVRVTSLDAYVPRDRRPANLAIRADSTVATVVVQAGRATGVQLVDGPEIRAGWIVLAAGTYGSPPILMRSGIGPADHLRGLGIDVQVDLPGVGENLADHPAVDLDSGWRGSATSGPILDSIATLRSSDAPTGGAPDLMFWATDPNGDEPGFWLDPILLKPESRGSEAVAPLDVMRILLRMSSASVRSYDVQVPNKTIYVSEGDLPIYSRAQELAGDNLSAAIAAALRRYVDVEEGKREGFDEIIVRVGPGKGRKVRFTGILLGVWANTSYTEVFRVYRSRTGKFVVHVERHPEYTMVNEKGEPAGWRGYLGIGNVSYGTKVGESTIEVVESLDELRERIPPPLFDMVAGAAQQPPIEDLDI